jgi:hypothetical protein
VAPLASLGRACVTTPPPLSDAEQFAAALRAVQDLLGQHQAHGLDWHVLAAFDAIRRAEADLAAIRRAEAAGCDVSVPSAASIIIFDRLHRQILAAMTDYARRKLAATARPPADHTAGRIVAAMQCEYQRLRVHQVKWLAGNTKTPPLSSVAANIHKRVAKSLGCSVMTVFRGWTEVWLHKAPLAERERARALIAEVEGLGDRVAAMVKEQAAKTLKTGRWGRLEISPKAPRDMK